MSISNFAIYARVSTIDGKQDYNRQIDDLTNLIKRENPNSHIEIFAESVSGYKKGEKDRPKLNELLSKIRINPEEYRSIYVSEISRLGRDPKVTREIVDELTELGVNIYIQSLGINTLDPDGKRNFITSIILQVLIEYANLEAETFKDRSKSGLLRSARQGKVGGGKYYPYGYTKNEENILIIDTEEAEVIKRIFQLYLDGNGINKIKNILNADQVPTKLNRIFENKILKFNNEKNSSEIKWSDSQVYGILTNSIYIGKRRFKGNILTAPSIIQEYDFNECNKLLKSKNSKGDSVYTFLLKGIIKCSCCGRNYVGRYKPNPGEDKVYKCSSTRDKNIHCVNTGINIKLLESVVFHLVCITSLSVNSLNNSIELQAELERNMSEVENNIKILTNQIKDKKKSLDNLLEVYLKSKTIDVRKLDDTNEKLNVEIDKLEEKLSSNKIQLLNMSKQKESSHTTNLDIIFSSKNNRQNLQKIFREIINKITVIKTTPNEVNLLVEINLYNNNKLLIEIVLHKKGIMKKDKKYIYHVEKIHPVNEDRTIGELDRNFTKKLEKNTSLKFITENVIYYTYNDILNINNNIKETIKLSTEIDYLSNLGLTEEFLIDMN